MTDNPYLDGYSNPDRAPPSGLDITGNSLYLTGLQSARWEQAAAPHASSPNNNYDGMAVAAARYAAQCLEQKNRNEENKLNLGYDGEYGVPFHDYLYEGGFSQNNPAYYAAGLTRFFNSLSTTARSGYSQIFEQCSNNPRNYHLFDRLRPYSPLEKMMDGFMLRAQPSKAEHAGARWCYERGLLLGNRYIPTKLEQIESRKSLLQRAFNWRTTYWAPGIFFLDCYRHFMFPTVNEVAPPGPRLQHQYIDPIDTAAYRTDEKYREFVNLRNFGIRPK